MSFSNSAFHFKFMFPLSVMLAKALLSLCCNFSDPKSVLWRNDNAIYLSACLGGRATLLARSSLHKRQKIALLYMLTQQAMAALGIGQALQVRKWREFCCGDRCSLALCKLVVIKS